MTTVSWWRDQNDLDKDQREVIKLDIDEDYLLLGPPGCGKTNILALRGSYLSRMQKQNILFISFTRTLKEFIGAGTKNRYKLPEGCVQTFWSWSYATLVSAGVPKDVLRADAAAKFDEKRQRRVELLMDLIHRGVFSREFYDAILVDEVQDFWAPELEVLRQLTPRLFAGGDNRQRIYARNEGVSTVIKLGCQRIDLKKHYRNGRAICAVADRILPDPDGNLLLDNCQYREADDPSTADLLPQAPLCDQIAAICVSVREQMRLYKKEFIGILCPDHDVLSAVWELISASDIGEKAMLQRYEDGYEAFDLDTPVCVMTTHASKGLEFKAVHIPGAEAFGNSRNLAFTAVTRAKTSLSMYHSAPLMGWLSGAFARAPDREPELGELF